MSVGPSLYQKAKENNLLQDIYDLRNNVKNRRDLEQIPGITPSFISGSLTGILRALGNEMDRRIKGINKTMDGRTGPIAYEEAEKIDKLIGGLQKICAEVNPSKNYSGMLSELGKQIDKS
jgi:hypothetical protein